MLKIAQQLTDTQPKRDPSDTGEIAAVQAAVASQNGALPDNMFAPFTFPSENVGQTQTRGQQPVVHYGNVDTGSMVNVMYSGVLEANPHLNAYRAEFSHVICGVGNKVTKVICKLVNVPLSLGTKPEPGSLVKATFYVIACPGYHFILGLTLLGAVRGMVNCGERTLVYTLGPTGKSAQRSIPLRDRQAVKSTLAYLAVKEREKRAHVDQVTWHAHIPPPSMIPYVEEGLVDILAYATLENEKTQYIDTFPAALEGPVVDFVIPVSPEPS